MTVTYSRETLATRLRTLQDVIVDEGGAQVAQRMGDLAQRLEQEELQVTLAFCGLFSAGKSSLINALCSTQALATGAVPTTATVTSLAYEGTHGEVVLMDTPGIDSTDEAHQAAMEAALHRADLVALVMDYQHVEAEDNLDMARALSDQGKQLIIVINQIDKHFDWELPFEEFCRRVERTFADYGIPYRAIFYTTTRTSEHNQVQAFRAWLDELTDSSQAIVSDSLLVSARDLVTQHVTQKFAAQVEASEAALLEVLGMVPFDMDEANAWMGEKMEQLRGFDEYQSAEMSGLLEKQTSVREEFARTIDLAQISPYETTELGRLYVESLRPGFRIGWLGSKEKTEKEIHDRQHAFMSALMEKTQKYLLWPLQNSLREFIQSAVWALPEWSRDVDGLTVQLSPETCRHLVHDGALVSDQYPYQYVKDVVAYVKRQISGQLIQCFDKWFPQSLETKRTEWIDMEEKRGKISREQARLADWLMVHREQADRIAELCAALQPDKDEPYVNGGL